MSLTFQSQDILIEQSSDNTSLGDSYQIQCTAYTDEMVNPNNVTVSWTGPNDTITNDSRLTITPTSSNGTSHTSTLQFSYLSKDDEGDYSCSLVMLGAELNESKSFSSKFTHCTSIYSHSSQY